MKLTAKLTAKLKEKFAGKFKNILSISLMASLALHLMTVLALNSVKKNPISNPKNETIEITFIDPSQLKDTRSLQIVEQDQKPVNDEVDPNAKYLSQSNQRVVKETRADKTGKFNNSAGSGINMGRRSSKIDSLIPKVDWSALAQKNNEEQPQKNGGNGLEVSKSSDYLKDAERGPQTVLSTREFLYYSYFARIKGKIQQYWEPSIKHKIEKMVSRGRGIASQEDRKTQLLIILNKQGTLIGVKLLGMSGVEDLDDAAVEAFKAAAPFPNPPTGIVEDDGTIKIRWDFVLEA